MLLVTNITFKIWRGGGGGGDLKLEFCCSFCHYSLKTWSVWVMKSRQLKFLRSLVITCHTVYSIQMGFLVSFSTYNIDIIVSCPNYIKCNLSTLFHMERDVSVNNIFLAKALDLKLWTWSFAVFSFSVKGNC